MLAAQGMGCAGVLRCNESVMPNAKKHATQQAVIQIFRDLMEAVSENRRPMYSAKANIKNLASA